MMGYASPVLTGTPVMTLLTPEDARVILSRTKLYPRVTPRNMENIQKFRELMSAGLWVNDRRAHPVMITKKFVLINGSHRLLSLAQSDRPATLPILSEVDLKQLIDKLQTIKLK